ncbi:MAG TPA: efflux RND transporter periplasmic adaptor subunit, partial [Bacteroidia bacterium]|nr:efflux RND transporter periplasmic adaptor subunit [Bacteroidia bacterium]
DILIMFKYFSGNLFFTSLIGLLALDSCGSGNNSDSQKQKKDAPPAIEGYIVKPQPISDQIEVSGILLPSEETVLMPEISGRIIKLNLPEGTRVSKGTLLVKLFDADLQAQLNKLNAQLNTAKATADRQKELLKINGISQQDYDQSVTLVTSLEADIASVNAQLSKTEIRAPFDGTIGLRKISEGAFVSPGTPLAVIRAEQQLKLDFSVPETYASIINTKTSILFSIDNDTTVYSATVMATEQSVDEGSLNLQVRALVTSHDKHLIPGTSATVTIGFDGHKEALLVPTEAVIPQARFKSVIVNRKGVAVFVKAKTGIRTATSVEILSGLSAGDTVVTTGIQFIRPGTVLKFSSVK